MTLGGSPRFGRVPLIAALAAVAAIAVAVLATTSGPGTAHAANANVNIGDGGLQFTPNHVAITAGESVTWTWVAGFHDVQSNTSAFSSGAAQRASGQTFTNTFTTPGTFWFYCSVHARAEDANEQGQGAGKMVGSVTVLPGSPGVASQQATATPTATATRTATATSTAAASATATAPATATASTTPSAPKTGSAGLASSSDAAAMAVLWVAVASVMVLGARALGRRGR